MNDIPSLRDILGNEGVYTRIKLDMAEGEVRPFVLTGYTRREGNWGEYLAVYLESPEDGTPYFFTTKSAWNEHILESLASREAFPVKVAIKRAKRGFIIDDWRIATT